jgi:hypothetical protein
MVVKLGRTPRAVSSPTRWKFADDLGHPFGDYFRVADQPLEMFLRGRNMGLNLSSGIKKRGIGLCSPGCAENGPFPRHLSRLMKAARLA